MILHDQLHIAVCIEGSDERSEQDVDPLAIGRATDEEERLAHTVGHLVGRPFAVEDLQIDAERDDSDSFGWNAARDRAVAAPGGEDPELVIVASDDLGPAPGIRTEVPRPHRDPPACRRQRDLAEPRGVVVVHEQVGARVVNDRDAVLEERASPRRVHDRERGRPVVATEQPYRRRVGHHATPAEVVDEAIEFGEVGAQLQLEDVDALHERSHQAEEVGLIFGARETVERLHGLDDPAHRFSSAPMVGSRSDHRREKTRARSEPRRRRAKRAHGRPAPPLSW